MTNSTLQTLTKLLINNALEDKPCTGLLLAYTEEVKALCEDESDDADPNDVLDVVEESSECERIMFEEFARCYKHALEHKVSTETCLEVFEYPQELPATKVPRQILLLIAGAVGRRDADMANAVRRHVMARA